MFPLRTILVPTDFSEHSELAFRLACSLARDQGGRVVALFVLTPPAIGNAEGAYLPLPENYKDAWEEKLHALHAPTPIVAIEHLLVEGDPVDEILLVARSTGCDLIILGHGRTGLKHLLLGSVAEQVVRTAPCPVLTVKAQPTAKVAAKAKEMQHAVTV